MSEETIPVTRGSGNVFEDLGFENPEEVRAKASLVLRIRQTIETRGLTQSQAADLAGMKPPHLSRLLRGGYHAATFDKIFQILNALGEDVDVVVAAAPREQERGHTSVKAG